MEDVPRPLPKHLYHEKTRHRTLVWYVRVGKGPRTRIKHEYGTEAFWEDYRAALKGKPAQGAPKKDSVRWLIDAYRASGEWKALAPGTRAWREGVYKQAIKRIGDRAFRTISAASIQVSMDQRADKPAAANQLLKAMSALFHWAVGRKIVAANPCHGVRRLKTRSDGHHTWTEAECAKFEARWPLGTKQRLAFDILLYTGLRRGDAVTLGRQHLRQEDGETWFLIRTEKTGAVVDAPVLPELTRSIAATKTGDLAFLVTEYGRPFAKAGFGNWFRDACRAADVPGAAHGLRKAGATRAAERGATEAQLNALFGWGDGSNEGKGYIKRANRKRMAKAAAELLTNENARTSTPKSRTSKNKAQSQ